MRIFFTTFLSLSLVVPVFAQVSQVQIRSQNTIRLEQNTGNEFLRGVQESREEQQLREHFLQNIQSIVPLGNTTSSLVVPGGSDAIQDNAQGFRIEIKEKRGDLQSGSKNTDQGVGEEVRTTIRVQDVAPQAVQELRAKQQELRENFEERRIEFREALEEKKTELRERLEQKKIEIRERVQAFIADEQKQVIVERVYDQVNALNERLTGHYTEILDKLDAVLSGVLSRAGKAEAVGRDLSAVRSAVAEAQNMLVAARALVAEQAQKSYSFEISSEETLRSDVGEARNLLREDLESVKEKIREVHSAIREAAVSLAQVPNVDDIEIEEETTPVSSDRTGTVEAQ